MKCDVCEEEEAIFMVGDMATGEQQALGPGCYARAGLEFAKAVLPAEEIAAALGPLFVNPPAEPPTKPGEAPGRPKRQKASKESKPAQGADGGAPEVATAAEDG